MTLLHAIEPVEYTLSPAGVMHLRSQHPDTYQTLCGMIVKGKGWRLGDETMLGTSATCLPCRSQRAQEARNASLGNYDADEGVDRCTNCGGKYWENDICTGCKAVWTPEARGDEGV